MLRLGKYKLLVATVPSAKTTFPTYRRRRRRAPLPSVDYDEILDNEQGERAYDRVLEKAGSVYTYRPCDWKICEEAIYKYYNSPLLKLLFGSQLNPIVERVAENREACKRDVALSCLVEQELVGTWRQSARHPILAPVNAIIEHRLKVELHRLRSAAVLSARSVIHNEHYLYSLVLYFYLAWLGDDDLIKGLRFMRHLYDLEFSYARAPNSGTVIIRGVPTYVLSTPTSASDFNLAPSPFFSPQIMHFRSEFLRYFNYNGNYASVYARNMGEERKI